MARVLSTALMAALLGLAPGGARAQDAGSYQGAAAALKALSEKPAPGIVDPEDKQGLLRRDLEQFPKQAAGMAPAEAAKSWLALLERYAALGNERHMRRRGNEEPLQFKDVLAAVPPPAAWNALAEAVQARQPAAEKRTAGDVALLLVAHLLQGDEAVLAKDAAALQALVAKAGQEERQYLAPVLISVQEALAERASGPDAAIRLVELRLAHQRLVPEMAAGRPVAVPDLVTLVGAQRAEALLRRWLTTQKVEFSVPTGDATRRLARRLALEGVLKLKAPQWSLAHALDAGRLYEALEKRFPPSKRAPGDEEEFDPRMRFGGRMPPPDYSGERGSWQTARLYYLLGLIVAKRTPEATALAVQLPINDLPADAMQALHRAGHAAALSEFFRTLLAKKPALPLWDVYISAATSAGQTGPMIAAVRAAIGKPGLPADLKQQLRGHLYKALLAADQVDEGVALLRQLVAEAGSGPRSPESYYAATRALELARLGHLLKQEAWLKEGLAAAVEATINTEDPGGYGGMMEHGLKQIAALLVEIGRGPEAEKLLIDGLRRTARAASPEMPFMPQADTLVELAGLYHHAGRHADVLALLDGAPNWMAKDLVAVMTGKDSREVPLGHMAAAALVATGRKPEALAILEALLQAQNDFDPAYALLVELRGQEVLPFLERLAARDRFQERPLIWKAILLFQAKRLEEAEQAARAAIAIDPSDGEQHFGRRMRVYAVLADIREVRGDSAQAALFRGAVKAIRTSEEADKVHEAGLVACGIRLYKQALTYFADAYCIQSRLAIQLAEQGRPEEAETHYRRAYELMPDSFGRMETHCLGCEGAFSGAQAQRIAEEVFKQLIAKTPQKPQVHYLLGYLREQQERYQEALEHFRAAVQRDPDYINAWRHLLAISQRAHVPQADRDAAALALFRLDPQGRHMEGEESDVGNLRALWAAVEAAQQAQPPPAPDTLFPLKASKEAMEKLETLVGSPDVLPGRGADMMMMERMMSRYGRPGRPGDTAIPPPGQVIAATRLLSSLGQLIEYQLQRQAGADH